MPKKTTMKKTMTKKIKGNGILDGIKGLYEKGKKANSYLKEKKYASTALAAFPQLKE